MLRILFNFKRTLRASAPLMALWIILMMLPSCSDTDTSFSEGAAANETVPHNVSVCFNIGIDSKNATRGGRELWSSEPFQQICNLNVYMFYSPDETTPMRFLKKIDIPEADFNFTSPAGNTDKEYTIDSLLKDGIYKFVALGFESKDLSGAYSFPEMTPGVTTLEEMSVKLIEGSKVADEFFATVSEDYVITRKSRVLNASIELNRVPAGVLAYFCNIPYSDPETGNRVNTLEVKILRKGTEVDLNGFNPKSQSEPELTEGAVDQSQYLSLFSFSLTDLEKDGSNNRVKISSTDWRAEGYEAGKSPEKVAKKENSVLAGCFLLPFDEITGNSTLRVELYTIDKKEKESLWKSFDVVCFNARGRKDFPILANNYYALGEKPIKENPDGDEPIDLTEVLDRPDLVITVHGSWQADVEIDM